MVNEEHLLKPYQELFGLSLDLGRGKRRREETAGSGPLGVKRSRFSAGSWGALGPLLKSLGKLFVI